MTDTLIADAGGMYHSGDYNDRPVHGLKGTMSGGPSCTYCGRGSMPDRG